ARAVLKARTLPYNLDMLDEYVGGLNDERRQTASKDKDKPDPAADQETPGDAADSDPIQRMRDAQDKAVTSDLEAQAPRVDFLGYLTSDKLGDGEAQQKLRQL